MSKKLSSMNPYLHDPAARKSMVIRSVVTSSAIEGIRAGFKQARNGAVESAVRKDRINQKKVSPLT